MGTTKVAFLGPISSYTHQAAIECFPPAHYEHVAMVTFRDIFEALQTGQVPWGVVPFENSTNGSVVLILDLFADRANQFPDVSVCGEAYLDVHHYLLGHHAVRAPRNESAEIFQSSTPTPQIPDPSIPRTKPLSSLTHVERIYSHPHAFGQCEVFLGTHLKGIERIDVSSTSKAAELVKADITGKSVAIASKVAADIHGLTPLAKGIEDREDNTTRFFILRRGSEKVQSAGQVQESGPTNKSLVSFMVDHKSPGALANVLHCFKEYKLNLTSINSRPSRIIPFQYIFFLEFEGSKLDDPEGTVKEALNSAEKVAKSFRWLGSWVDQLRKNSD